MAYTRYEKELRERLMDHERWPDFDSPDFLDRLEAVAERAISRRTVDGKLAGILIYHQLVEEMIQLIAQDSQFLIQAALLPWRIEFPPPGRQTFGRRLQGLRFTVDFKRKNRFLALAEEMNSLRIDVVHKLTRRGSLQGLARDARRAKQLYEQCFHIFDEAHDRFWLDLGGIRKDLI